MRTFLVLLVLLAAVLIKRSATETDDADSFQIDPRSESDEEQPSNEWRNNIELDDNDYALLEDLDSLRRQNKRQAIISDILELPPENDEWRREKRLHCCRYYCRCCPYKCRWMCPLC